MKSLSVFKYDHGDKLRYTSTQRWIMSIGLALTALCFYKAGMAGIPLAVALVVYIAVVSPKKSISVNSRYLICGKQIVYYRNISRIAVQQQSGVIDLYSGSANVLHLEREKFPTAARKKDKIEKNKAGKFAKVCGKIVEKVVLASPGVELDGVDRPAPIESRPRSPAKARR